MDKKQDSHENCIVIRTKQETVAKLGSLYESVRWCWRININRALMADYVLAVVNYGTKEFKVEQVFKPTEWHCITAGECKDKKAPICTCKKKPCGRIGFTGKRVGTVEEKKYLGKIIDMGKRFASLRAARATKNGSRVCARRWNTLCAVLLRHIFLRP